MPIFERASDATQGNRLRFVIEALPYVLPPFRIVRRFPLPKIFPSGVDIYPLTISQHAQSDNPREDFQCGYVDDNLNTTSQVHLESSSVEPCFCLPGNKIVSEEEVYRPQCEDKLKLYELDTDRTVLENV
ncbi:hypothetical protein MMC20_000469 [Loxospora ochrophaea]|nr:hypothetical protein [Loxospora ochrophaea]